MTIHFRKVKTLCIKDFLDYFKNPAVFVSSLIPVFFLIFYKLINIPIGEEPGERYVFFLTLGTLINSSMSGLMIISTGIAEEKEKFTLRTLMLSNISGAEFLLSKVCVGLLITTLGNLLIFFLAGAPLGSLPIYLAANIFGNLSIAMLSAVVGLLSRDQMTCGIMQIPEMLVIMMPPIFGNLNNILRQIARVTPLNAMLYIYYAGTDGTLFTAKTVWHVAVLAVWIVLGSVLFGVVYKKKGLDN